MDSCVVDENIEVPVLVRDARGCALDARGVRYVDLDRHDRSACAAESGHCFLSSRRVATPQIDGQALPRELARDLSTQALVSAGHQRAVSFDVHFVFSVRLNKRTASCIWATNSIREPVRYFHPRAHAALRDLASVLSSPALQRWVHVDRSSFVFVCLPRSFPLLSRPLCPLCLCGESLLPSAFRPHRVPGVPSVCTLYRKYGGCRRSCPALKTGKRFTCVEVM